MSLRGLSWVVSSVQSLSCIQLFATPWTAACQASLSITNSRSLLKLKSIELVMASNHLMFCRPFLLLPSIFPIIRVFSNESVLCIRWPEDWSFSFNFSLSNESVQFSSVQFSNSVMSDSLRPHRLQDATLPCLSPTPRACSNSCPSSW